jgi:hypothetical protein
MIGLVTANSRVQMGHAGSTSFKAFCCYPGLTL